jgi:hypothetical protein
MARVRGRTLIDVMDFVRDAGGEPGLRATRAHLDPEARATFNGTLRESEWYPLEHLVSYLRAAKKALAPEEPGFYRRLGRFSGTRQKAYLGSMISPDARARLAGTIWRLFYDVGSVVISGEGEDSVGQVHDFPTTPELCERFLGSWEAASSTPEHEAHAVETRCVLRGDPYCEFKVR